MLFLQCNWSSMQGQLWRKGSGLEGISAHTIWPFSEDDATHTCAPVCSVQQIVLYMAENSYHWRLSITSVTVPGRKRMLSRRTFRLYLHAQSTASLNFHGGWSSYVLHRSLTYWCYYVARMSTALNRSSEIKRFEHTNVTEICDGIMFIFYLGLP